ncbi:MAG: hypothetical protein IJS90_08045 [Clostridia bacterium]|nr:hypothetical protein [Clostridia bacterium]
MKKIIAILLTLTFVLSLAACSSKSGGDKTDAATQNANPDVSADSSSDASAEQVTDAQGKVIPSNIPSESLSSIKETFDQMEYALYCNIFYEDNGKEYENKKLTKTGTFSIIQDEWSGKDRYYVWGYADQTRCCDFQWEFVPADVNSLPPVGSYIEVKGTFTYTEDQKTGALDHYWLTDTELKVKEAYTPDQDYDYDLTIMSATLARVQLFSMQNYTEAFAGKKVKVYGRAYSTKTLQHPYYDESWYLDFVADGKEPATGTYLILGGTLVQEGTGCWLNVTSYTEE